MESDEVIAAAGAESPAAAPAPAAPAAPAANEGPRDAIKDAATKARDMVAADKARREGAAPVVPAAGETPGETPGETDDEKATREAREAELANETPEEKTAREAREALIASETPEQTAEREAAEAAELMVELPPRAEGEEPYKIDVADKDTAERLRQLVKGYARGEQARVMREQAQAVRDEAQEINLGVELDPSGFVAEVIQKPDDIDHLTRFLLTRPGVLQRAAPWVAALLNAPESVAEAARMVDAERITRRDAVRGEIAAKSELNQNARQIIRTLDKTIDTVVPEHWTPEARGLFRKDLMDDIKAYARWQMAQDPNATKVDPRVIPGLVERRRKLLHLGAPAPTPPAVTGQPVAAGAPKKTPATPAQTAESLKKARAAVRAAGSAPPGAGSPVAAGVVAPPKYDPKQKGSPIQQAANNWRERAKNLVRRPQ